MTRFLSEDALWDDSVIGDLPKTSPMIEFYRNKNIFLTGATGGVGQLIMCKLLSIDIGQLTILVRGKKNISAMDRITEILKSPLFKRVRDNIKTFRSKINIIEGDLLEKNLGLSERDIDYLHRSTQIVFHVAADVRFDQPFKRAIYNNVRSVYDLLQLSVKMRKLESFLYMSTAYSNNVEYIEEKVYSLPLEPEMLIRYAETLDGERDHEFEIMTERVIAPWANTYTYTKNLAEFLVQKYGTRFPTAIIRPSIIIATERDPIPGWMDNIYGLNGVMIGFGLGVLRVLYANPKYVGDIIPSDYVANSTLAVAWHTAVESKKQVELNEESTKAVKIYNCVSSVDNPQTWEGVNQSLKIYHDYPSIRMVWYTTTNFATNLLTFKIYTLIYHCFPAFFIDKVLAWKGEKIRLMNVYRVIQRNIISGLCFMQNWKFSNTNMRLVLKNMNEDDHKFFPCDVKNISWPEYNYRYVLGIRVFFAKDPLDTLGKARKRCFKLKIAHYIVLTLYYSLISLILYGLVHMFDMQSYLHSVKDFLLLPFRH